MPKKKCFIAAALIIAFPWLVHSATVKQHNMKYVGGFRVPHGDVGYSYGGNVITYNPANHSLFIVGHHQLVSELAIPAPVDGEINTMHVATELQTLVDVTEGNLGKVGEGHTDVSAQVSGVRIGGLLVHGSTLYGSVYTFYDAGGFTVYSHWTSGLDLDQTGDFGGMYQVTNGLGPSFTSGWIAPVPPEWQAALGGDTLIGNGTLSIISRTSYGPAAFAVNIEDFGHNAPVPATPLLYYDSSHSVAGYDAEDGFFNGTTKIAGMVVIEGSVLYFGYHGIGEYNYGAHGSEPVYGDECRPPDSCTTSNKGYSVCSDGNNCTTGRKGLPYDPICNPTGSDGCYYDPTGIGGKGPHAYPYIYQVWAYSLQDMADVKSGIKAPWELRPYAIWELPYGGGATYDSVNKRLYISQPGKEHYGCCERLPVIHVVDIDMTVQAPSTHSVGGKVYLLEGSLTVENNGAEPVVVVASDRTDLVDFEFVDKVVEGGSYRLSITNQPDWLDCTIYNASGTVNANVTNVAIGCTAVSDAPPGIASGDVNGDGAITLVDPILALQVASGRETAGIVLASDADNDGRIGIAEVITALRKLAGFSAK